MTIEITGETEKIIQAALATGQYATVEEFIEAVVLHWKEYSSAKTSIPKMPKSIDANLLVGECGVKPCSNPASLATDIWPEGESTDEFLGFLRQERRDSRDRTPGL